MPATTLPAVEWRGACSAACPSVCWTGVLTEVQRVLGHSRLDTTARYLTPSGDDLRDALLKAGVL